jgi:hypothetical protein
LTQHLIADAERIEQLRERFTLVDKDNTNWTATYIDNDTGDKWLYYRVDTYLQGGGYPILGRQPLPDTKQLINLSLFSESDVKSLLLVGLWLTRKKLKRLTFVQT